MVHLNDIILQILDEEMTTGGGNLNTLNNTDVIPQSHVLTNTKSSFENRVLSSTITFTPPFDLPDDLREY